MTAPREGWTTKAKVLRVIDGDTLEVEVRRQMKVRLLDAWCPELHQPGGAAAKLFAQDLVKDREVMLHIPGDTAVENALTFGRVLGEVWINGMDLSEELRRAGHATREKDRHAKFPIVKLILWALLLALPGAAHAQDMVPVVGWREGIPLEQRADGWWYMPDDKGWQHTHQFAPGGT